MRDALACSKDARFRLRETPENKAKVASACVSAHSYSVRYKRLAVHSFSGKSLPHDDED
ncbi:hypothetical protein [Luteibacter sp. E-22]|uniref:hypothetical protein n=1 Tax=Luteibacter sp. E-22 TaxID=3404050 RepID=UPI003CF75E4E